MIARTVVVFPIPLRPSRVTNSPVPTPERNSEQHFGSRIAGVHVVYFKHRHHRRDSSPALARCCARPLAAR